MKTLEAVLALILTFAFILYMIPTPQNNLNGDTTNILISLIENENFRNYAINLSSCVFKEENTSINYILDEELKTFLNYSICPQGDIPSLPRKKVNVESIYFTGNLTDKTNKIIKLYYWE